MIREQGGNRPGLYGLVFGSIVIAMWSIPAMTGWPILWVAPLATYLLMVALVPILRRSFRIWKFGAVTFKSASAAAMLAALSCGALVAFHFYLRPDLTGYAGRLPIAAMGGAVWAGVIFSVANAAFEEIFFRGIFFDAVAPKLGNAAAVFLTAVVFGYGHKEGYPPGIIGAVLAGVYGLGLGILRVYTGGIGLGVLAHIAADATIFTLLVHSNVW